MKKSVISTLALGIIIGAGMVGVKSFANETSSNSLSNNINQGISNTQQGDYQFRQLNQQNNQFENLDNSQYENSNEYENDGYNYRNCCSYRAY